MQNSKHNASHVDKQEWMAILKGFLKFFVGGSKLPKNSLKYKKDVISLTFPWNFWSSGDYPEIFTDFLDMTDILC